MKGKPTEIAPFSCIFFTKKQREKPSSGFLEKQKAVDKSRIEYMKMTSDTGTEFLATKEKALGEETSLSLSLSLSLSRRRPSRSHDVAAICDLS